MPKSKPPELTTVQASLFGLRCFPSSVIHAGNRMIYQAYVYQYWGAIWSRERLADKFDYLHIPELTEDVGKPLEILIF